MTMYTVNSMNTVTKPTSFRGFCFKNVPDAVFDYSVYTRTNNFKPLSMTFNDIYLGSKNVHIG